MSILRYVAFALALKAFSLTPASRRVYQILGKKLGKERHTTVSIDEFRKALWICQMIDETELRLDENAKVLELGTGWTHFYAIFLRLLFNHQTVLFDVLDNRQLGSLKRRMVKLAALLPSRIPMTHAHRIAPIRQLATRVGAVDSFEELYDLLGMSYLIEPNGLLDALPSSYFDMVFSVDVLEHVDRRSLHSTISSMYRVLRPGGISIHLIGIDDHLSHYAPGVSSKNYLRYSTGMWELLFENNLQYFNRIQLPEFQRLFEASKFDSLRCVAGIDSNSLTQIVPHSDFQGFDVQALKTVSAWLVHRKPPYVGVFRE